MSHVSSKCSLFVGRWCMEDNCVFPRLLSGGLPCKYNDGSGLVHTVPTGHITVHCQGNYRNRQCHTQSSLVKARYGLEIGHYNDVIMGAKASQITSLMIVFSTVYLDSDQRKHQSSASLAFVRGIHRRPVNSPHKWPATRKMFPFDDVIM